MKTKKIILILCSFMLLALCFVGCDKIGKEEEGTYTLYYLNHEKTKVVSKAYERKAVDTSGFIEELLEVLCTDTDDMDYVKLLDDTVELVSWGLENKQLQLNFVSDYYEMDNVIEVLSRAALVRTLLQVEDVEGVVFYVGDSPLLNKNGVPVGVMTAESFIENPGQQINSIQTAVLTLYFSNEEGTALIAEEQERHYSGNIPVEKVVMDCIMNEPETINGKSAIPPETKLIGVSVLDGVCFVNLDSGFLNHDYQVEPEIVIYSIVNSLIEISNITKVQISVNGDTSITFREEFPLSTMFERNLDFLQTEDFGESDGEVEGEDETIEEKQKGKTVEE